MKERKRLNSGEAQTTVKEPFNEGKAAVGVDFFGTLGKFIHVNLIGQQWHYRKMDICNVLQTKELNN